MKRYILAFSLLILTLLPKEALPQTRQDVQRALERLDRKLAFAKDVVISFGNQRAKDLLREAKIQRDKAKAALEAGRYRVAMKRIKVAQDLVEKALKITLEGPIRRMRERLEELMRHAENVVIGSGNKEAERLLRKAKENHRKAIQAFLYRYYRKAMEHYRIATFLAEKSIDLVEGRATRSRISEERERFEGLMERARDTVERSGDEQAKRVLRQAVKQVQRVEEAIDRGDFKLAVNLYHRATRLLLRAIDLAEGRGKGIQARAQDEVSALGELISSAKEKIQESRDERAIFLLDRALTLEREAREALDGGRFQIALPKTDLARNLIGRALRAIEEKPQLLKGRIEEELERLEEDLKFIRAEVERSQVEEAIELLNMAQRSADRARKAFEQAQYRLALEGILAAHRFSSAAERLAAKAKPAGPRKEDIEERLQNLDKALSEAEGKIEKEAELASQFLQEAQRMRGEAQKAFDKGHLLLAQESIDMAFNLILKSMRMLK